MPPPPPKKNIILDLFSLLAIPYSCVRLGTLKKKKLKNIKTRTYWCEASLQIWLFLFQLKYLGVIVFLHRFDKVKFAAQQVQVLQESGWRGHTHRWRALQSKIILKIKV